MAVAPVGIFGGTFDPIHFGHLRLAEELLEQVAMDHIRFMPSGTPPHRSQPRTPAGHRSAMVQAAIAGHPGFMLDAREVNKATPCYTVESLNALRQQLGDSRPLCLILGSDAFLHLTSWHQWQQLLQLTHIIVGCRPGYLLAEHMEQAPDTLKQLFNRHRCQTEQLSQQPAGFICEMTIPQLEISSTLIRGRCNAQRSIRYLLPEAVINYIEQHKLYQLC